MSEHAPLCVSPILGTSGNIYGLQDDVYAPGVIENVWSPDDDNQQTTELLSAIWKEPGLKDTVHPVLAGALEFDCFAQTIQSEFNKTLDAPDLPGLINLEAKQADKIPQRSQGHFFGTAPTNEEVGSSESDEKGQPRRAGRQPRGGRGKKLNEEPVEQLVRKVLEHCEEQKFLRVETSSVEQMQAEYDLTRTHVKQLRGGVYFKSALFEKEDFAAICAVFNAGIKHGRDKEKGLASTINSTATQALKYHFGITAGEGRSEWSGGHWFFDYSKARKSFESAQKNNRRSANAQSSSASVSASASSASSV
eukprot:2398771-Rhodomonas_salina.1